MSNNLTYYHKTEERLNVYTHLIGLGLSIVALILLIQKSINQDSGLYLVSFTVFGVSLIILYTASTLYHASKKPKLRERLNIFDHASIYVLIAGTYTPFVLITLKGVVGWWFFGIIWSIAIIGVILKFFFTGRYDKLSTAMYVFMGWIIVFAIKPLIENLEVEGLQWLFFGGVFYTLGAIIYSLRKIKFNHVIFHVFVLLGSFSHFMAIYFYV